MIYFDIESGFRCGCTTVRDFLIFLLVFVAKNFDGFHAFEVAKFR